MSNASEIKDSELAPGEDARPPFAGVGVAANLLDEIRGRIWFNTGCSDDAAENAAAAVYDLFLDERARGADMLDALGVVAGLLCGDSCGELDRLDAFKVADAAIAMAMASHPAGEPHEDAQRRANPDLALIKPLAEGELREAVARIVRGWPLPPEGQRIGPGTKRAIEEADAKAAEILAILPPDHTERAKGVQLGEHERDALDDADDADLEAWLGDR